MRENKKRKKLLHSATRRIRRDDGSTGRLIGGIIAVVAGIALTIGLVTGVNALQKLWLEQCIIKDVSKQVTIVTGNHVKSGVILDGFGLKEGANLAQIDFKAKRLELLARVPNIKSLVIARQLPDRVKITVNEREPVARMGIKGQKNMTGRVVDADGVVFLRRIGTDMLPIIREPVSSGTMPGRSLSGRTASALKLVMLSADKEFSGLGILEVDTSPKDYLLAVLGNYQRAKICWDGIDEPTAGTEKNMLSQLRNLQRAVNSNIASRAILWNATEPGRVTADTKEPIL